MIVLGINASHCATACLLIDGVVIACISEERLTRIKNQAGIPYNAINEVLRITNLTKNNIDKVAFSFEDMAINSGFSVLDKGLNESISKQNSPLLALIWHTKEWLLSNFKFTRTIYPPLQSFVYKNILFKNMKENILKEFENKTGIDRTKVFFVDHHTSHIYSAYFGSPDYWKGKKLILTLDAMGDGVCATVNVGNRENIKRISTTPYGNSIGDLYAYITRYLGMKMGEHEYKVMGMAPYANEKYVNKVYEKIKDWVWVEKNIKYNIRFLYALYVRRIKKGRNDQNIM